MTTTIGSIRWLFMVIFSLGIAGTVGADDQYPFDVQSLPQNLTRENFARFDNTIYLPRTLLPCFIAEFADHPMRFVAMARKVGDDLSHDGTAEIECRGAVWRVEVGE